MSLLLLDEEEEITLPPAQRPKKRLTMRFMGGDSDSAGLRLHVDDTLLSLEMELLGPGDAVMPMTGRTVFLRWRVNEEASTVRPADVTDETAGLALYGLDLGDLPEQGILALEAVIADDTGGNLTSDPLKIPVEASV